MHQICDQSKNVHFGRDVVREEVVDLLFRSYANKWICYTHFNEKSKWLTGQSGPSQFHHFAHQSAMLIRVPSPFIKILLSLLIKWTDCCSNMMFSNHWYDQICTFMTFMCWPSAFKIPLALESTYERGNIYRIQYFYFLFLMTLYTNNPSKWQTLLSKFTIACGFWKSKSDKDSVLSCKLIKIR